MARKSMVRNRTFDVQGREAEALRFARAQSQAQREVQNILEGLDLSSIFRELDQTSKDRIQSPELPARTDIGDRLRRVTSNLRPADVRREGEFTFPQTQRIARQQREQQLEDRFRDLARQMAPSRGAPGDERAVGSGEVIPADTTIRGRPAHELKGYQELQSVTYAATNEAGVPTNWATNRAFINLINGESGWDPTAANPTSSAFGLAQFLRSTWRNYLPEVPYGTADPFWQLVGAFRYIRDVYGTPDRAWAFWRATVNANPNLAPADLRGKARIWVGRGYKGY